MTLVDKSPQRYDYDFGSRKRHSRERDRERSQRRRRRRSRSRSRTRRSERSDRSDRSDRYSYEEDRPRGDGNWEEKLFEQVFSNREHSTEEKKRFKKTAQKYTVEIDRSLLESVGISSRPRSATIASNVARRNTYYSKRQPEACKWFRIGRCTKGSVCSYRHEMP